MISRQVPALSEEKKDMHKKKRPSARKTKNVFKKSSVDIYRFTILRTEALPRYYFFKSNKDSQFPTRQRINVTCPWALCSVPCLSVTNTSHTYTSS